MVLYVEFDVPFNPLIATTPRCDVHRVPTVSHANCFQVYRLAGSFVSGYSGVCFEIKFSGRHREFDGVLFEL